MTDEILLVDSPAPHVRRLTLNRPGSLNAFSAELRERLGEELAATAHDRDVRVVVLRGAGRAFTVGADVAPRPPGVSSGSYLEGDTAAADFERLADRTIDLFLDVWRLPIPVIAQIHGYCMGIGLILAQCCDMVFTDDKTVFGWPGAPLGGGMIAPVWAHSIGAHRAKEFSLTVGARVTAFEAERLGFVNRVVAAEELESTVLTTATHTARLSRDLIRMKKQAINDVQARQGFEQTMRAGAAWDALAHETEVVHETRARIREEGLKAVLADWAAPARNGLTQ